MGNRTLGALSAGIVASVWLAGAPPSRAEQACDEAPAWEVTEGELAPGRACGSYVATTNGATTAYSLGQLVSTTEVTLPYRASVTWRRLGGDPRALELGVLGGIVLVADDRIALWIDDATFELDGWRPLPGHRVRRVHTVTAIQDDTTLIIEIDGQEAARWALASRARRGHLSILFKGRAGGRAKIWFAGFAVASGQGAAGAHAGSSRSK